MSSPEQKSELPRGVIVAHVYRSGDELIYLAHSGAHPTLELDADITFPFRDWNEANVIYEDAPPTPPQQNGLWEMRLAWTEHPDHATKQTELCCLYDGPATWIHLAEGLPNG